MIRKILIACLLFAGVATAQVQTFDHRLRRDLDANGFDFADGGAIYLREQADAGVDVADQGQIWVKAGAPNTLWFTNEDGTSLQLNGGATQLSELTDVNTSTPTNRNVLVADGVDWESRALVEADISDLQSYLLTTSIDLSAELAAIVTDETGSGALAFGTEPTIANGTFTGTTTLGSVAYTWPGADGTAGYVLSTNGAGTLSWAVDAGGLQTTDIDTSAEIAAIVTDETGTGSLVFNNAPTFIAPALGTPASGVATNLTGTAAGLTAGTVTTNANLTGHVTSTGNAAVLGSFTSANLSTALTDETGTGAAVFATSPQLVTPAIPAMTTGSVLFSGASGVVSQDNANLFWDDTNNRLGIGTVTPAEILQLSRNNASVRIADVSSNSGTGPRVLLVSNWGGTEYTAPIGFSFYSGRTYIQHGRTNVGGIELRSADGTARVYVQDSGGKVGINQATPTAQLDVKTAAVGTVGLKVDTIAGQTADLFQATVNGGSPNKFAIGAGGTVRIGTATVPTGTATKVLAFGDNAGNPTAGTDQGLVYATDISGTTTPYAADESSNRMPLVPFKTTTTLGAAATTFAISGTLIDLTGDPGANTVGTITGGYPGREITILFNDALVTITDTDAHTANTVDLAGVATNLTSADDLTLRLIHDGTSWYETSRSTN